MIRVELQGGLGNQLFIWAMAHKLSEAYGSQVRIIVPLDKHRQKDRPCELFGLLDLCQHNISIEESSSFSLLTKVVDKITPYKIVKKLRILARLRITTKEFHDDVTINLSHTPRVIRGFFQSNEIPESTKKHVFAEIKSYLKTIEFPRNLHGSEINCVAHIRRGDTKSIAKQWGILTLDYYKQILKSETNVVICTDEIEMLNNFFETFPTAVVVSAIESTPWQVLKIMANSKKFVMANSTLSWWGAWIAIQAGDTQIFYPEPWRPGNDKMSQSLKLKATISRQSMFEVI
jgi:hypothetical protein